MERAEQMKDDEFEHREDIDNPLQPHGRALTVLVAKTGGGTPDRAYDGTWTYRVRQAGSREGDGIVTQGNDLRTGTPKTHRQVVRIIEDFLPDLLSRT